MAQNGYGTVFEITTNGGSLPFIPLPTQRRSGPFRGFDAGPNGYFYGLPLVTTAARMVMCLR